MLKFITAAAIITGIALTMMLHLSNAHAKTYLMKPLPAAKASSTEVTATPTASNQPTEEPPATPKPVKFEKDAVINAINENLSGALKGKGESFYKAFEKHRVSAMMMAAIAMHETANGTSDLVRNANNVCGMNWVQGEKRQKYKKWYVKYSSIDESIMDMASRLDEFYIKEGRGSIDKISKKWAPVSDPRNGMYGMDNGSWGQAVEKNYLKMLEKAQNPSGAGTPKQVSSK